MFTTGARYHCYVAKIESDCDLVSGTTRITLSMMRRFAAILAQAYTMR